MSRSHPETHVIDRTAWLRAAVLGANDGVISVSSLVVGMATGGGAQSSVLLAGVAGLIAGAMSMAAGEYVSVRSQADSENADLDRERAELASEPDRELDELAAIYVNRGVDPVLALQVARQLTAKDALGAHARDELGLTESLRARPLQAALASAAAFALGGVIPVATVMLAPSTWMVGSLVSTALLALVTLGGVAARAGGASVVEGATRVVFWGALAMALTAVAGRLFGASI